MGRKIENAIINYQNRINQFNCEGNVSMESQKGVHRTTVLCRPQFEYHCSSMRQKWKGPCCVFKYFSRLLNGLQCVNQHRFWPLCFFPFSLHNYSHIHEVFTICSHYASHEMCKYEGNTGCYVSSIILYV